MTLKIILSHFKTSSYLKYVKMKLLAVLNVPLIFMQRTDIKQFCGSSRSGGHLFPGRFDRNISECFPPQDSPALRPAVGMRPQPGESAELGCGDRYTTHATGEQANRALCITVS